MKKLYIIMLVFLSACIFVSCKKASDKDTVAINTPAPTQKVEATPAPTMAAPAEESPQQEDSTGNATEDSSGAVSDISYDISEVSYFSDDSIRIYYPQLVHMDNKTVQDKINELIRLAAMRDTEGFDISDPDNTLINDYIISWKGRRLLSIRFLGDINNTQAAYPSSFSYSVNINLNTGEIVKLTDLFLTDEGILNAFEAKGNSKYLYFDENRVLKEDTSFGQPDILSTIKDYVFQTYENSALSDTDSENAQIHTYYTEDSLGFSFDTVHAIGDYIQFEMKYSDLQKYIRQDNSIWTDLIGELNAPETADMPEEESSAGEDFVIDENLIWKNINYVPGFSIIKDQSFRVDFENWGEVYFITGEGEGDFALNSLYLYLADNNSNILYEFPSFYGNGSMLYDLTAVSFRDVNDDGRKDVIVIAEYMNGVGTTGAQEFPVADVYFQTADGFISLPEVSDKINSSGQNDSISKVSDYVKELDLNLD